MPERPASLLPAASGLQHNTGIDLLRGLAIVFVLLNHRSTAPASRSGARGSPRSACT
jgi:hypothetical protein